MKTKQNIDKWEQYFQLLFDSTDVDTNESEVEQKKRIKKLEANPELWFSYYFPKYTYATPAQFHIDATQRIIKNPEHYEIRMWSRELAKSTRTMMEVFYLVLVGHPISGGRKPVRKKKKYCLLISNSFENACRLLAPFKANFEYNRRIANDYGNQDGSGKWQASEFITEGGASFRALGAGQSPRGTRNDEARPDIILFDDIDTDADCLNPEIIAKKWRWIEEAAIGTRSVSEPTTIIFCGNRIAIDCCITRAETFADYVDVKNIRDENNLSVWPQKNTEEHIERVLKQKSYAAAQKEYFNNPVMEGAIFKQLNWKPSLPINQYSKLVCYTDPSYTHTGDFKATVLVGTYNNEYHIIKAFLEQTTSATLLDWYRQIYKMIDGQNTCRFYMEDVFIQDTLVHEVNNQRLSINPYFTLHGDKRKKPDKFTRIETMLEPMVRNGLLFLNENEKHNPHMARLENQFKTFAFGSSAHDDGPDAVEGAVWILQEQQRVDTSSFVQFGRELRNNRM